MAKVPARDATASTLNVERQIREVRTHEPQLGLIEIAAATVHSLTELARPDNVHKMRLSQPHARLNCAVEDYCAAPSALERPIKSELLKRHVGPKGISRAKRGDNSVEQDRT
jgi:hypothetical protein